MISKGTEADAGLVALFAYLDSSYVPLEAFGCFTALSWDKLTIFTYPMNVDGIADRDASHPRHMDWSEVTAPEPEFIDYVNAMFGTTFDRNQFSGR